MYNTKDWLLARALDCQKIAKLNRLPRDLRVRKTLQMEHPPQYSGYSLQAAYPQQASSGYAPPHRQWQSSRYPQPGPGFQQQQVIQLGAPQQRPGGVQIINVQESKQLMTTILQDTRLLTVSHN